MPEEPRLPTWQDLTPERRWIDSRDTPVGPR